MCVWNYFRTRRALPTIFRTMWSLTNFTSVSSVRRAALTWRVCGPTWEAMLKLEMEPYCTVQVFWAYSCFETFLGNQIFCRQSVKIFNLWPSIFAMLTCFNTCWWDKAKQGGKIFHHTLHLAAMTGYYVMSSTVLIVIAWKCFLSLWTGRAYVIELIFLSLSWQDHI